MEIRTRGIGGAEGWEKGKGVIVRRDLKEAQSKSAGRGTRTGSEVEDGAVHWMKPMRSTAKNDDSNLPVLFRFRVGKHLIDLPTF